MSLSDPLRPPGTTPRRAEPVQPDRPGRGLDPLDSTDDQSSGRSSDQEEDTVKRQREQSQAAIDNMRNS